MVVRGGRRTRRRGGAKGGNFFRTRKSKPSKSVERVMPAVAVVRPDCPACQARALLEADTASYKAKPWYKRMTLKHPGKKAEKKRMKNIRKATWSWHEPPGTGKRMAGEQYVEHMAHAGLNLDGLPMHNHSLFEDESVAGGRKRRRRKGRKGRRTRRG